MRVDVIYALTSDETFRQLNVNSVKWKQTPISAMSANVGLLFANAPIRRIGHKFLYSSIS